MRDLFPTAPSERIAMTCAYGLIALCWWMVTHPHSVGAFLRGLVP